jgi:hypothetical protein
MSAATTTVTRPITTTAIIDDDDDDDDNVIWEDPDLDFVIVEPTTSTVPIPTSSHPLSTELPDDIDVVYFSSTIPLQPVEHFDFIEQIPASSTITGGMAVAGQDSQFNWWDLDEATFPPLTEPNPSPPPTTTTIAANPFTLIPSTTKLTNFEDDWAIFNKTSTPSVTKFDHLSNSDIDVDMNDYFPVPSILRTSTIDSITNNTPPFVPYYFTDYKTNDQLLDLLKPSPTLAMPPFSWMLHLANQNKSAPQGRQSLINKNSTMPSKKTIKKKRMDSKTMINDNFYEHCNKKQCQHGGRLNTDCLCICLPAFGGDNCEISKNIYI